MINSSLLKTNQNQNYKAFSNKDNTIINILDDNSITTLFCKTNTIPVDNNNVIVFIKDLKRIVWGQIKLDDYVRITTNDNSKLYFKHSEISVLGVVKSYTVRHQIVN